MLEIYHTESEGVHEKLRAILERRLGKNYEIKRTENGKPYISGNPLYFSLSHSADGAMIAVCDKPVGIDFESTKLKRNYAHILARFTERERRFMQSDCDFLKNWVSKEAFVKMTGGTLARDLKRLEFYGGCLFFDGQKVNGLKIGNVPDGIYAVCTEGEII